MYRLDELHYLYQDLEPYIDTHTMGIHYNKHAKKYLDTLNQLLSEEGFSFDVSIEKLASNIDFYEFKRKEDILFHLGGVLNHNLYFKCMSKEYQGPSSFLLKAIVEKYGSLEEFYKAYIQMALSLKGSGYTFLEYNHGDLVLKNRSNQESPLFDKSVPLFTIDMWEHDYYLNYKNEKGEYLNQFFKIADFSYANKEYAQQIKKE